MQHPVGYAINADGTFGLTSLAAMLTNPWAIWQYLHNMIAAVVTGSVAMTALGAFYLLIHQFEDFGRMFVRLGVIAGLIASLLMVFPTGDGQGRNVARYQPATLAAMEGLFENHRGAPLVLIGQPDVDARKLDNPIVVPEVLSFLTYRHWKAEVQGLLEFPSDQWPDNIALLYYAYHIMVGLGTIFVGVFALAGLLLYLDRLYDTTLMLWALMLLAPFPYIATTAGWITAELGRQPWLVYGLMRTSAGKSPLVSVGSGLFTLIGFMGMYAALAVLFLFLVYLEIQRGPGGAEPASSHDALAAAN
jgi:cytochrome d ubiquinol oxidase subunit I